MREIAGVTAKGLPFRLRPHRKTDIQTLPLLLSNAKVVENLKDFPHPYTLEHAREWVNQNLYSSTYKATNLVRAIEVEGRLAGAIGLAEIKRGHFARLGYWLGQPYWNRGLATATVQLMVAFAFREYDLVRLEATTYHWNIASRRVLEKNGFLFEGVLRKRLVNNFGRLGDEWVYAIVG